MGPLRSLELTVCGELRLPAGLTEDTPLQGRKRTKHLEGEARAARVMAPALAGAALTKLQTGSVNRASFPTAAEAASPSLRCPPGWGLVRAFSLAPSCCVLVWPSSLHTCREGEPPGVSSSSDWDTRPVG